MDYYNSVLSAIFAVIAPCFSGSAVITNSQELPSLLEIKVELNGHSPVNGHSHAYKPSVTVPLYRGVRREAKKSPAPSPQNIHGYRMPRECYRKVAGR